MNVFAARNSISGFYLSLRFVIIVWEVILDLHSITNFYPSYIESLQLQLFVSSDDSFQVLF